MNYKYQECGHDYDVSWDYELRENVDSFLVFHADDACQRIRKELLPKLLLFKDFSLYWADCEGDLGRYIDGTVSQPVVLLDNRAIDIATDEFGVDEEVAIETTILHELGHAIQEALGINRQTAKAERQAEHFAQIWFWHREISESFKKLLSEQFIELDDTET